MKTNITRDIDKQYGYDLEIETSFTREDGFMCAALLNGEQIDMFYGSTAEADAKQRLFAEVTHQINGGAQSYAEYNAAEPTDESPYGELPAPTFAQLVEAREAAYIAQRDAEQELADLKAALTADIAGNPVYKNDASRKAALAAQLHDYPGTVGNATKTADAYRRALAAIEVYQEQAKDQRARLRHETAQMELEAAKLHLQASQAKQVSTESKANEDDDDDCYVESHLAPNAINFEILPNYETQYSWDLIDDRSLSRYESGYFAGYVANAVYQDRSCVDLMLDKQGMIVVFTDEGDCQNYCITMRNVHGYAEWSPRKVWHELPR